MKAEEERQKKEVEARMKAEEERRKKEADDRRNWSNWKQVASCKPVRWKVPTSIEITKTPENFKSELGIYYHTPQPFNIDVYISYSSKCLYYYVAPQYAGWRTTSGGVPKRNGCADPQSKSLGSGNQYPAG